MSNAAYKRPGEYHAAFDDHNEACWELVQALKLMHFNDMLPEELRPLVEKLRTAEKKLKDEFDVVPGPPHLIMRKCSCNGCVGK